MTTPGAGAFESDFYEATQAISAGLEEIQTEYRNLEERLNRVLRFLFPPISDGLIAAFEELNGVMHKFMDVLQKLITEPGYPPALFRIGDSWEIEVGQKLSERAALMAPARLAAATSFEGRAAKAYGFAAEEQSKATESFMSLSSSMKSALHELANSQIMFLLAVGVAVTTAVVAIASAAVSAGTVVGAPLAPPIAIAGVSGAIIMLLSLAPIIYDAYSKMKTAIATMDSELRGSAGMPDGKWPTIGEQITNNRKPWKVETD
ncbi:hypothetical protein KZ829_08880 [Actinoplanes hulinensis]|uniref:WXG100 family type VII secretion target n=1 Tax=Actinoplanes hulinensis TaxID=1144547 RepID=A0ABS7AYN3_9ACTN|nr:hypothetical protein [Actinoplanes hulinensis]MBW6433848.1 hypothetical protein [Actinoplanes hulinensis]